MASTSSMVSGSSNDFCTEAAEEVITVVSSKVFASVRKVTPVREYIGIAADKTAEKTGFAYMMIIR